MIPLTILLTRVMTESHDYLHDHLWPWLLMAIVPAVIVFLGIVSIIGHLKNKT